jgi:DNA-binding transcriptional ArsR family regulator
VAGRRIDDPDQLAALAAPLRQEICNALAGLGEASTVELARELGTPADALYYHVRKLLEVGLLAECGRRPTARRDETIYALAHPGAKLRYRPDDEGNAEQVRRIVRGALKAAATDFDDGIGSELAVTVGKRRNLWGARHRCWLSDEELREVNELLARLGEIFTSTGTAGEGTLCSLTWVLAPLEPRPLRRQPVDN